MAYKRTSAPETPDIKTAQGKESIMDFLKEILGDELFSQVAEKINAYNGDEANKDNQIKIGNLGSGKYVSKLTLDDVTGQLKSKQTELDAANGLIEELKKGTKGDEKLQGKVTAYETQVTQLQEQLKQTQLDSAIKVALLAAKANDVDYMTFKLKEKGDLELDDKGQVKGIDDMISGLKTQFPNQFEVDGGKGGIIDPHPLPGGEGGHHTEPKTLAEALEMQFNEQDN